MRRFIRFESTNGPVFINPTYIVEFRQENDSASILKVDGLSRRIVVSSNVDEVAYQIEQALADHD